MADDVVSGEAEIVNDLGLHARAATKLVKLARQFVSEIEVSLDGMTANAKSILGLMALGARKGKRVGLVVKGADRMEAYEAIRRLIECGFEENRG